MNDKWAAVQEIEVFLMSLETLLQTLNDEGVDSTNVLRERVAVAVESLQAELSQAMQSLEVKYEPYADWVHEHPEWAVTVSAIAGGALAAALYTLPERRR